MAMNIVRYADFARLLTEACDNNPDIPKDIQERVLWIGAQLERANMGSYQKSIMGWFQGTTIPRPWQRTEALEKILGVEPGYLKVAANPAQEIRHADFAKRLDIAFKNHPQAPRYGAGVLPWIVNQYANRFGTDVTPESVRRWIIGISRPHPFEKMRQLAEILDVDVAWLSTGKSEAIDEKESTLRKMSADGAVNLIAGMIQMSGSHPAFPPEDDKFAKDNLVDIYAIIKGVQHAFHVTTAVEKDGKMTFMIPMAARNTIVIGVVPDGGLKYSIVQIDFDRAERLGTKRSNAIMIDYETLDPRPVNTFAKRL